MCCARVFVHVCACLHVCMHECVCACGYIKVMDCTANVYSYLAGFAVCVSAYIILTNDTNYKCYIKTVKLAKTII